MSIQLSKNDPSTVTAALDAFESSLPRLRSDLSVTHRVGPFGVFRLQSAPIESIAAKRAVLELHTPAINLDIATSTNREAERSAPPSSADPVGSPLGFVGAVPEWHGDVDAFLTSSLESMQWDDLFQWDLGPFSAGDMHPASPQQIAMDCAKVDSGEKTSGPTKGDNDANHNSWPELDLMNEAPLLLKHFNDKVIGQMGSLPINEKSAWRILNYPSAILTLSQLTMLAVDRGAIKHANLANFFALIAVSALHLSLSDCNGCDNAGIRSMARDWELLRSQTYELAKHHMRLSFEDECTLPGKAKYKDQLMAISAILATAVSYHPLRPNSRSANGSKSCFPETTKMAAGTS